MNYCIYCIIFMILVIIFCFDFKNNINNINLNKKTKKSNDNLDKIKDNFNINKSFIIFNPANLPVKTVYEYNKNNITNLFKLIFKNTNIKLKNIIDVEINKIDIQNINNIIYETNIGLINLIIISEKNNYHDFSNNLEKNYLLKLEKINNYTKQNDNLDIDQSFK